ncbi:MAG: aspartate/glutamate racemase family protein [Variovorax sp.]|nr:aspartate/glutamate racemase family protein [Variovorax sp.]
MSRPLTTYGRRARLGLIVPPTNSVNEAEWQLLLREMDDVSLHVTRMALHLDTTSAEGRAALDADIAKAVDDLAAACVDAIAYGCTAGSMVAPLDGVAAAMTMRCGLPCVATASALVHAARSLGCRRVAVATPYHDALNAHECEFLQANGLEVLGIRGLGIGAGGVHEYVRIARLPPEQVLAHVRASWQPGADGLIVSCTDLPTLHAVPVLEAELGVPVITSNLATFWQLLDVLGLGELAPGHGRLLRSRPR